MNAKTEAHLLRLAWAQKDGVPLFPDSVRVPCPHIIGDWESSGSTDATGRMPLMDMRLCSICQGRGWVPSTDPMVWAKVLRPLLEPYEKMEFLLGSVADEVWGYKSNIAWGDFDEAIPHAVKALELVEALEVIT